MHLFFMFKHTPILIDLKRTSRKCMDCFDCVHFDIAGAKSTKAEFNLTVLSSQARDPWKLIKGLKEIEFGTFAYFHHLNNITDLSECCHWEARQFDPMTIRTHSHYFFQAVEPHYHDYSTQNLSLFDHSVGDNSMPNIDKWITKMNQDVKWLMFAGLFYFWWFRL